MFHFLQTIKAPFIIIIILYDFVLWCINVSEYARMRTALQRLRYWCWSLWEHFKVQVQGKFYDRNRFLVQLLFMRRWTRVRRSEGNKKGKFFSFSQFYIVCSFVYHEMPSLDRKTPVMFCLLSYIVIVINNGHMRCVQAKDIWPLFFKTTINEICWCRLFNNNKSNNVIVEHKCI